MNLSLAIILLLLALVGLVLIKTYSALPIVELKRRAARGDNSAKQLYKAVAYGHSLRALLLIYIPLTGGASIVFLARVLPLWLSLVIILAILWVVFSAVPTNPPSRLALSLTCLLSPFIAWLLNYLHPLLGLSSSLVSKQPKEHTGLYEREDLIKLINRQQSQADNRLSEQELLIIKNAIRFSEHSVADILTPRKQIKSVLAEETIGPVLIDELHKANQAFAVVRESPKGPIIGTLATTKLGIGSKGEVSSVMYAPAYYLHEDDSLSEALYAFSLTNQPVFVIVNNFEEYVGLISVETILKKLLGHLPGSDFEEYTDLTAVAARHNQTSVKTDEEVLE